MNRLIPIFLVLSSITAAAQQPTWKQIEADTRQRWIRARPTEAVVSVEKVGQPKYTPQPGKPKTPGDLSPASVWAWAWDESAWSPTVARREGAYMRQMMRVVVDRADASRARHSVAALYRLVGSAWVFAEIPVGAPQSLAAVGAPTPPSNTAAAKLFAAAWTRKLPDLTVHDVKVLGKAPHQNAGRYWLAVKLTVTATGTGTAPEPLRGKRVVCSPSEMLSVLNWDKKAGRWVADESMIGAVDRFADCKAE